MTDKGWQFKLYCNDNKNKSDEKYVITDESSLAFDIDDGFYSNMIYMAKVFGLSDDVLKKIVPKDLRDKIADWKKNDYAGNPLVSNYPGLKFSYNDTFNNMYNSKKIDFNKSDDTDVNLKNINKRIKNIFG